jgi:hypothetical protein
VSAGGVPTAAPLVEQGGAECHNWSGGRSAYQHPQGPLPGSGRGWSALLADSQAPCSSPELLRPPDQPGACLDRQEGAARPNLEGSGPRDRRIALLTDRKGPRAHKAHSSVLGNGGLLPLDRRAPSDGAYKCGAAQPPPFWTAKVLGCSAASGKQRD